MAYEPRQQRAQRVPRVFEIKEGVREWMPALITLWGGSGSGKTYSALEFARGLVGEQGKIIVIDTENKRAKNLYGSGKVGGHWQHINFEPPFDAYSFIDAFRQAVKSGAHCIIVDSLSHVWMGEGGLLDQVDEKGSTFGAFGKPKNEIRRMTNVMLISPCHVIFCMRGKMVNVQYEDQWGKTKVEQRGWEPTMEKGWVFDMLISVMLGSDKKPVFVNAAGLSQDGVKVSPNIPPVKAPAELISSIKPGEYLSRANGAAVKAWLDSASRNIIDEGHRYAEQGTAVLKAWWDLLSRDDKITCGTDLKNRWKARSVQADAMAAKSQEKPQDTGEENGQGQGYGDQQNPVTSGFDGYQPPAQQAPSPPTVAPPAPPPPAQAAPPPPPAPSYQQPGPGRVPLTAPAATWPPADDGDDESIF